MRLSTTQAGLGLPSTSTVIVIRAWTPPGMSSTPLSSAPTRTRLPTGTGGFTFHRPDGTPFEPPTPPPTPCQPIEDATGATPRGPTQDTYDPLTHWTLDCIIGHLGNLDQHHQATDPERGPPDDSSPDEDDTTPPD